jgi:hypothetical protein
MITPSTRGTEEVAPMANLITTRPSMSLPAAFAPSASRLPCAAPVSVLVTERAPVSRVHQVQVQVQAQAESARTLIRLRGIDGTTGFVGSYGAAARMTDGAKGVPPRGRPV